MTPRPEGRERPAAPPRPLAPQPRPSPPPVVLREPRPRRAARGAHRAADRRPPREARTARRSPLRAPVSNAAARRTPRARTHCSIKSRIRVDVRVTDPARPRAPTRPTARMAPHRSDRIARTASSASSRATRAPPLPSRPARPTPNASRRSVASGPARRSPELRAARSSVAEDPLQGPLGDGKPGASWKARTGRIPRDR